MTEDEAAKRVAGKLLGELCCPNCGAPIEGHADNSCILNVFIDILKDRANKSAAELAQLHATCNVDALWDDLSKVLNSLEDGDYRV